MTEIIYDALIIGGGPAGMFMGSYGSRKGLNLLLIEKSKELGGRPLKEFPEKPVYDFPSYPDIKTKDLINGFIDQVKVSNTKILLGVYALSATHTNNIFNVKLSNNTSIKCRNVVLATGTHIGGDKLNTSNNRYIVDINNQTSILHVYAIGDNCIYPNKPSSMSTACGEASIVIRTIINSLK